MIAQRFSKMQYNEQVLAAVVLGCLGAKRSEPPNTPKPLTASSMLGS